MRSLNLLLCSITSALVIGCNSEPLSTSTSEQRETAGEPASCDDVDAYLRNLAPVLEQWEPAIDTSLEADVLSTPPALTDTTSSDEYLTGLSTVLAEWEVALETFRGTDFLITPPPFDPPTTPADIYLTTVAPLLSDWRNAIEFWRGQDFLEAPPLFAEDTVPPTLSCISDTTVTAIASEGVKVEFVITASDLCDEDPEIICTPPSGTVFPVGKHTVVCTATDDDSNSSECSFTITVEGDTKLPTITCPADTTVSCAGPEGTPVEFVVTAEDTGGETLEVTCEPASDSLFPLGETLVTCSATNDAGTVECSFTVTVSDTTAPEITCLEDIHVTCAPAEGAVVEFDVIASDACEGDIVVVSEPPSGSTFPIGTTAVTSTATDASGNTTSCSFSITVDEALPPEIAGVTASREYLWPPNHNMVAVDVAVELEEACGEITCRIERVISSEPENGTGDGDTAPDWEIVDDDTVRLRAERAGHGTGRVYTIEVTCMDGSGSSTMSTVDVIVPHDMGG